VIFPLEVSLGLPLGLPLGASVGPSVGASPEVSFRDLPRFPSEVSPVRNSSVSSYTFALRFAQWFRLVMGVLAWWVTVNTSNGNKIRTW